MHKSAPRRSAAGRASATHHGSSRKDGWRHSIKLLVNCLRSTAGQILQLHTHHSRFSKQGIHCTTFVAWWDVCSYGCPTSVTALSDKLLSKNLPLQLHWPLVMQAV